MSFTNRRLVVEDASINELYRGWKYEEEDGDLTPYACGNACLAIFDSLASKTGKGYQLLAGTGILVVYGDVETPNKNEIIKIIKTIRKKVNENILNNPKCWDHRRKTTSEYNAQKRKIVVSMLEIMA